MPVLNNTCAICRRKITGDAPSIFTPPPIDAFPEGHPLWNYSETQMHQECLVEWEHRVEFASAYCDIRGAGYVLMEEALWTLYCGPLVYGPYGKAELPYYAEIRPREWPIRLKSGFQGWTEFIAERQWERTCIEPLNAYIRSLLPTFPQTTERLEELLLPRLVALLERGAHHRSRYVAVLGLELLGDKARSAIPVLREALDDEHGSVRQAAHILLKNWGGTG